MRFDELLCRTLGCRSPFARRWEWPHAICCWWMNAHEKADD